MNSPQPSTGGSKQPCDGAHCKCMEPACPNNHYGDHACPYYDFGPTKINVIAGTDVRANTYPSNPAETPEKEFFLASGKNEASPRDTDTDEFVEELLAQPPALVTHKELAMYKARGRRIALQAQRTLAKKMRNRWVAQLEPPGVRDACRVSDVIKHFDTEIAQIDTQLTGEGGKT